MNLLRRLLRRSSRQLPFSATVDLDDPAISADPVPAYEALRGEGPVLYLPRHGLWLVLGYDAAREAFGDPGRFSSAPYDFVDPAMLAADPPRHGDVRRVVSRAFGGDTLRRLERLATAAAEALVRPRLEIVTGFARPLSRSVAADLIGFDAEAVAAILRVEEQAEAAPAPDSFAAICAAIDAVAPQASLFARLAADGADLLQPDDVRSLVRLLWLASTATTERVIARAVLALAEEPALHRRLKDDERLLAPFVEEVVRLYPPENLIRRRTIGPATLAGTSVPPGTEIAICLPAANRDPDRFEAPHTLRLERSGPAPLSFGFGIHHCVGAPMTRRVALAALRVLVRSAESVEREGQVEWLHAMMVCAPKRLRVRL